jgi:hypothetical protein
MTDRPKTWKEWFEHAFSLDGGAEPLSEADTALLERVCKGVVARGLSMPALMFLESVRPLSFIGGQVLVFFQPMLEMFLKAAEIERAARLLERRDVLEMMAVRIEALEAEKKRG